MKQFLVIQSVGQIYDLGSWKFSKHIGAHTFILLSTQLLGTIYSNAIPILESNKRSAYIYERYDLRPYTYIILSWGLWCSTDAQDLGRLACCLSICLSAMLISWHHGCYTCCRRTHQCLQLETKPIDDQLTPQAAGAGSIELWFIFKGSRLMIILQDASVTNIQSWWLDFYCKLDDIATLQPGNLAM